MKRKVWMMLGVVAIVALAAILWLGNSLDAIVKSGVEHFGPQIAGTDVKLGSAEVRLREGRATLRGLRIRNPDGFSSEDALSLGEITLDIDTGSLTEEPIVVETLRIAGPALLLEMTADGSVNLRSLQQNVEEYAPAVDAKAAPPRIAVKTLTMEGGTLRLDARSVGGELSERKLAAFTLRDLGGTSGVPADELGQEVLRAVLRGALRGAAMEELEQKAGDELKEAGRQLLKGLGG